MEKKLRTSGFARLYVWTGRAKETMGLFYVGFVFMYLFFGLVSEGPVVMLDMFTAIQMLFACFFIGLAQQFFVPSGTLTRGRGVLWGLCSIGITLGFSLGFGWFAAFPVWCFVCFQLFVGCGFAAMMVMYYFELYYETRQLNRGLEQFQKNGRQV